MKIPQNLTIDAQTSLALLKEEDASSLFILTDNNRDHLGQWLPWVEHVTKEEDSLKFIKDGLNDLKSRRAFHYGIWHNRQLVGVIGAHHWEPDNRFLEIGYWICEEAQGKGIISKACRSLVDALFKQTDTETVLICCEPENKRSSAIPMKLGLKCIERIRRDEKTFDVYQIGSTDWK